MDELKSIEKPEKDFAYKIPIYLTYIQAKVHNDTYISHMHMLPLSLIM